MADKFINMTGFHYEVDGFAFSNKFAFNAKEKQQIIDTVKKQKDALFALFGVATGIDVALTTLFLIPPGTGELLAGLTLGGVFDQLIKNAIPNKQRGFCGGVAWSAMDFYAAGLLSDRGQQDPATGDSLAEVSGPQGTLRNYIWQRHLDSLTSGGAAVTTIEAIVYQHFAPNGPETLLGKAKAEWAKIKKSLDAGDPCPIGVVDPSTNPTDGHQVIVLGYELLDSAGDQVKLYLYDVNWPYGSGVHDPMTIDFRGKALSIDWAGSNVIPKPVYFYATSYTPKDPPVSLAVVSGITATTPEAAVGAPVTLTYELQNQGFGDTVSIVPFVTTYRPEQETSTTKAPAKLPPPPWPRKPLQMDPTPVPAPPAPTPPADLMKAASGAFFPSKAAPVVIASDYDGTNGAKQSPAPASNRLAVAITGTLSEGYWQYGPAVQATTPDGTVLTRYVRTGSSSASLEAGSYVPWPPAKASSGGSASGSGTGHGATGGTTGGAAGHGTGPAPARSGS